jgi:flagellar biosynthesis protein FlhG
MSQVVAFPTRKPPAPVIALASGKGGVGKTWLSVTLAGALASLGDRVLLVDGDLGLANVDIQLGVQPERDLGHVMSGEATLAEAVVRIAGGAMRPGGFDLIAGRNGSGPLADTDAREAQRLAAGIAALSFSYDRILVDLAAGIGHAMLRLACEADGVLIVAQDEPSSLTDGYSFVKLLRGLRPGAGVGVVANRVRGATEARRIHASFERACAAWLDFVPAQAGAIRDDHLVKSALRAQTPLNVHAPQSKALLDVKEFARMVRGGQAFRTRLPQVATG